MTDDLLNKLFEQVRNEASETNVEEVAGWVSVAAGAGAVGFLSLLKLKFLTTKGMMYLVSIFLGVGIGITTLVNLKTENVEQNKLTSSKVKADKPAEFVESVVLYDSIDENKSQELPDKASNIDYSTPQKKEQQNQPISVIPLPPISLVIPPPDIRPAPSMIPPMKKLKNGFEVQDRIVGSFNKLNICSAFNVEIKQGSSHSVRVEAESKIIDDISTKTSGDELVIRLLKNYKTKDLDGLKIYITVVDLNKISLSGAVNIKSEGEISTNDLNINTSGACNINLMIKSKNIDVVCSGASDLTLSGTADYLNFQTSGATKANCYDLEANIVKIGSSGASDLKCKVIDKLKVKASGASKINYKGSPEEIDINTSGAASIKRQ